MAFPEACHLGFSLDTQVFSRLSLVNGSANKIKAKINAISTLSNLIAELLLRTMWHTTCCT